MNVRSKSLGPRELSKRAERRRDERRVVAQRDHTAFNLILEPLIAALDKLSLNKQATS
jgi:hypothetical protein